STAGVFADPQLTRDMPNLTVADFLAEPDWLAADSRFHNVCEPVACRQFPVIAEALASLADQVGNSRMTGSGACVFARLDGPQTGERLLTRLPAGWKGFVARGCQQSPLHQALAELE